MEHDYPMREERLRTELNNLFVELTNIGNQMREFGVTYDMASREIRKPGIGTQMTYELSEIMAITRNQIEYLTKLYSEKQTEYYLKLGQYNEYLGHHEQFMSY